MCRTHHTTCLTCLTTTTTLSPCPIHLSRPLNPPIHNTTNHAHTISECSTCASLRLEEGLEAIRRRQGEVDPRIDRNLAREEEEREALVRWRRGVLWGQRWKVGLRGAEGVEKGDVGEGRLRGEGEGEGNGVRNEEIDGVEEGKMDDDVGLVEYEERKVVVAKALKGRLWRGFHEKSD